MASSVVSGDVDEGSSTIVFLGDGSKKRENGDYSSSQSKVMKHQLYSPEETTNKSEGSRDKGKGVVREGSIDLNKPWSHLSSKKADAINICILSDTESDDSVRNAGHESLFGRPDDNLSSWLLGKFEADKKEKEGNAEAEDAQDQVVPQVSSWCRTDFSAFPRPPVGVKLLPFRLLRCVIRSTNPGDDGLVYYITGGQKFKVLYQFVASRFNYKATELCMHLHFGKVPGTWTPDEVNMENNATLTVHGMKPQMNLDSRYKVFNVTNVGNISTICRLTVFSNCSVEELYRAWGREIGRRVSSFRLACHNYELPPTGLLRDTKLKNEDVIYSILLNNS